MVRDPISRILSHWCHATGAGYETRPMEEALARPDQAYVTRSMYWMQLQPYLEHFDRSQIEVITQEELQSDREGTMRKAFRFAGVDENFTSEQFDREWEKSSAKESDRYQFMEKLIKLPGFRSFDRNFDRLPERMRWMVEKVVHDPEAPPAPKPELPDSIRDRLHRALRRGRRGAPAVRRPRVRGLEELPRRSLRAPSHLPWVHEDRRSRRRAGGGRRGRARGAAEARPRAAPARRPQRRGARRLGLGERGGRPRRRRGARRAGDRLLLDRDGSLDRRQQGRRASAPPSASTPRRPRGPGAGTTPTPSPSASGRPRRRSWRRSSTPGSAASPAPRTMTAPTSSTSARSRTAGERRARSRARRTRSGGFSRTRLRPPSPSSSPTLDYKPLAHEDRPYVALNFATTLDGRAAIDGRSGADRQRGRTPRCCSGCAPASTR